MTIRTYRIQAMTGQQLCHMPIGGKIVTISNQGGDIILHCEDPGTNHGYRKFYIYAEADDAQWQGHCETERYIGTINYKPLFNPKVTFYVYEEMDYEPTPHESGTRLGALLQLEKTDAEHQELKSLSELYEEKQGRLENRVAALEEMCKPAIATRCKNE